MVAVRVVEQRVEFSATVRRALPRRARRGGARRAVAGAIATYGSPLHMASRVSHALESKPPKLTANQSARLETLSLNGRPMLWRSALDDVGDHPLLGSGAGTFEQYWNQHRPRPYFARDAHSLYLERLAEQGPVGLVLVIALLGYPLAIAVRNRRDPAVVTAAGALVAFAVHAGFDWDWEMPAVTGLALVAASAIVLSAATEHVAPLSNRSGRVSWPRPSRSAPWRSSAGSETRPSPRAPTRPRVASS